MWRAKIKYSGNKTNLTAHLARHRVDVQLTQHYNAKENMWTPLNSLWSNLVQISLPKPQVVQPKKKKKVLFFISFARIWTVSVLQRTKASVIQRIQKEPRYPIPSSNTSLPLLCPSCTRRSKWRCWNLSEPRKTRLRESLWRMTPGLQGRGIQTKRCATNKSDMTVSRELLQTMCPILESRLDLQTWPRTMFCTQPESRLAESAEVDNTLRDYSAESDVWQPFSEAEPKLATS